LLLLTLKWLRRYPTIHDLAIEFLTTQRRIARYVEKVLEVLVNALEYMRSWPSRYGTKIQKGPLKGTVGAVDTFPICIQQPKAKEDRKRHFIYKPGHHTRYGWKVQTFVDLRGRILDVTDAHPFGSKSDIKLFRESRVPGKLSASVRAMAPSPVNLAERIEKRINSATVIRTKSNHGPEEETVDSENEYEANEEGEDKKNLQEAQSQHEVEPQIEAPAIKNVSKALGDKAYLGSDLVYVPYKRFKGKRFTRQKKEFNKLLGSKRVIVENANKRLEDWRVLGTIFRGWRDSEFVSKVVRVVVSLYNYTLEEHPLRKGKRKA
jgi:hypothetical protein